MNVARFPLGRSIQLPALKARLDLRVDRRSKARYPLNGSVVLDTGLKRQYTALPVNLALGGVLIQANRVPPPETPGLMELKVDGFDEVVFANVRIIRSDGSLAAAIFVEHDPTLVRCVDWLASKDLEAKA